MCKNIGVSCFSKGLYVFVETYKCTQKITPHKWHLKPINNQLDFEENLYQKHL